jgi:hypothetical protein
MSGQSDQQRRNPLMEDVARCSSHSTVKKQATYKT